LLDETESPSFSYGEYVNINLLVTLTGSWVAEIIHPKYGVQMYSYKQNGEKICAYLAVPDYPQPTTVSCGATNIAMHIKWSSKVESLNDIVTLNSDFIKQVYNDVNSNGISGIDAGELKNGLITKFSKYKFLISVNEKGADSIKEAGKLILNDVLLYKRPVIFYGNSVSEISFIRYENVSGGHYMTIPAIINWGENYFFAVNDPIYNSPAYQDSFLDPIKPWTWIAEEDIEEYWNKTGSAYIWKRKHLYIITR
jgi:hypothetical protein